MTGWNAATSVIAVIAGSSLLAAFASNWQQARQHKKGIVSAASLSAQRRVEMYYRVRRRRPNHEDDVTIRDMFHEIQEDNDHYASQLSIEAPWLGDAYGRYLKALKKELQPLMSDAWKPENASGPGAQLLGDVKPDVNWIVTRFAKDGRRLFNPISRPLARTQYSLRKLFKKDPYESK